MWAKEKLAVNNHLLAFVAPRQNIPPLSREAWQVGLPYRWVLVLNAFGSVQDRTVSSAQTQAVVPKFAWNPGKADVSLRYFCLDGRIWWFLKIKRREYNIKKSASHANRFLRFCLSLAYLEQWHTRQCHPASRVHAESFCGVKENELLWLIHLWTIMCNVPDEFGLV